MSDHRVAAWMTKLDCAAECGRPLVRGQLAIVEERPDYFVPANRYRVWHRDCHPTVVDYRFWQIVKKARALAS